MAFPYYRGEGRQPDEPVVLPQPHSRQLREPTNYRPSQGLIDACNVALLLGQPLLLTGEPGTGKTQFAYSVAWELGLGEPLKFETKSTSDARDLFYTYDALHRFQDAQSGIRSSNALPYLRYNALGQAILHTLAYDDVRQIVPDEFKHPGKMRSVVLIDEIDKAPRDFPNDILNELEQMYFRIPELGNVKVEADPALYPVVLITSNSEKALPDAFLRRCVYYHIPFPERTRLEEIILSRLGDTIRDRKAVVKDALDLFLLLREQSSGLHKKPATAELLSWLVALQQVGKDVENPLVNQDLLLSTLSILVKTANDQPRAQEITEEWLRNR
jgi:MoxR-like ATPase